MRQPPFEIEEVSDPVEVARCKAQDELARRNSHWLQSHWADLLPQARGKFVPVAGQEAFIGDTPEEAWAWAAKNHPEDNGALVRYVRVGQGPRIYRKIGRRVVHVRAIGFLRFHPVLPIIAEVACAAVMSEAGTTAVLSLWREW